MIGMVNPLEKLGGCPLIRKEVILVTGASGEMGQALIEELYQQGRRNILGLDLREIPPAVKALCAEAVEGDILNEGLMDRLLSHYAIPVVYHLAALLSTRAEFVPELAHRVNVDGLLSLLKMAVDQSSWLGYPVKFMFPSSVAAYGVPDLAQKAKAGAVREFEWNVPITMYGCNKLYGEHLGRYYTRHYRQLAAGNNLPGVDFRAIRFPGLISAFTLPTGGTSDYGPEMIHAAASGQHYDCFVRPDTRMPFMAMPDAIRSLIMLEAAPREALSQQVYNVTSFSLSAAEIEQKVRGAFINADIGYEVDQQRQVIVDSWPADQDDSKARRDWGWKPAYDLERAFFEYLIPNITARYR